MGFVAADESGKQWQYKAKADKGREMSLSLGFMVMESTWSHGNGLQRLKSQSFLQLEFLSHTLPETPQWESCVYFCNIVTSLCNTLLLLLAIALQHIVSDRLRGGTSLSM